MKEELSNDEIALYDRQIRLWGIEAQRRIKTAKVLLINLGAVGTEIAKNLILGGIGSLTICDSHKISSADFNAQFYISKDHMGQHRVVSAKQNLQGLNPRVELSIDSENYDAKNKKWYENFDLIIATELTKDSYVKINNISRELNLPFYATGLNGLYGYVFIDLISHTATYKKEKPSIATVPGKVTSFSEIVSVSTSSENDIVYESVTTKDTYVSLEEVLNYSPKRLQELYNTPKKKRRINPVLIFTLAYLDGGNTVEILLEKAKSICKSLELPDSVVSGKEEFTEKFLQQTEVEFAPVSAIIGGVVAQDVINMLGSKNKPLNNFLVLDGISQEMPIYPL